MRSDETLMAELAELRATLADQQRVIQQQQATIDALERRMTAATQAATDDSADEADATPSLAPSLAPSLTSQRRTSRRGLLVGAAGVASAATVAAMAIGEPQVAQAATGGNLVLGAANDANAVTLLTNTTSATPNIILQVLANEPNTPCNAIYAEAYYGAFSSATPKAAPNTGAGVQVAAVTGASDSGYGMLARSASNVDLALMGSGRLWQTTQLQAGPPTSAVQYSSGESIRDTNGELWLCVASGAPGTWVKVAHLAPGISAGGAINYLSRPIRLFDSRPGATDALFTPHQPCAGGTSTTVQVTGAVFNGVTVPAALSGAMGNVTVINEAGEGYLELVPSGEGFTGAANLAFDVNQTISNAYNVGLNNGALDIYVSGTTDVIVDLFAVVS